MGSVNGKLPPDSVDILKGSVIDYSEELKGKSIRNAWIPSS